jgi:LCP family protein required for cell wall assembly
MIPLVLLTVVLVFGGALALFVNSRLSTFNSITRPAPDSIPGQALAMAEQGSGADWGIVPPSGAGGTTMLLMGVDAREGESVDFGVRADSLSVLHLEGGTCRTLSIPRDTRALLPGYGYSKINHALAVGGVEYQTLVVEQLLGVEIDHFTLIDFDGMAGVVDAIGGVTVSTPTELSYEGVTVPAGTNTINGDQALVFARFRDDPEGDFGRQRRQQELLQAIIRQAGPLDAAQALPAVLTDLEGHLKTDLRAGGVASMGFGFLRGCLASGIENGGLDGSVGNDWDDLEGMELSFVHVPETEIAAKVNWLTNGSVAGTTEPASVRAYGRRLSALSA